MELYQLATVLLTVFFFGGMILIAIDYFRKKFLKKKSWLDRPFDGHH